MTKTPLAIALLAATLGLAACTPAGQTPAGYSSTDRTPGRSASSAGLPAGNAEAGRTLATSKNPLTGQSCIACHGQGGNAPIDPSYPKLGGQYSDYLAHSLQLYRSGDRGNALMAAQAKNLTDQQIADVAAYFGSQRSQLRDLSGLE